jgi:hypothetical protein
MSAEEEGLLPKHGHRKTITKEEHTNPCSIGMLKTVTVMR